MIPKPLSIIPQLKPKRLPERKAVTIVAGFRCSEGIVVCADTLETIGDISKRHVPKVRFERCEPERGDLAVAFCGATNNGPFLDEIVDRAWRGVQAAPGHTPTSNGPLHPVRSDSRNACPPDPARR